MTLTKFKSYIKVSGLVSLVAFYGLCAFYLGHHFTSGLGAPQVKGVRTQASLDEQIERPEPFSDVQSAQITASSVDFCSNTAYSFQLAYPKDWFTTYNDKYQECTFFAPYSFVVPSYVEHDIVPINIVPVAPSQWQSTVKLYENPNDYQNVVSSKNIEISGKSVEVIDSTATGNGFVPMGFIKRSYLVFDARVPLVVYYQQLNANEDVNSSEKVLEDIVSSLKYF